MLKGLKVFGISEGYFDLKRIGDFTNSKKEGFSHIDTEAIDYDTTAKKLGDEQNQSSFKSCDALDIVDSKNKINFIEFKRLRDTKDIENWIQHLDLPQKIKDSHHILRDIIKKKGFVHKNTKMKTYNYCEKNTIISFDLTDDATKRMASLLRTLVVVELIKKQFDNNYIYGENFNDPICIKMDDFDANYEKYA